MHRALFAAALLGMMGLVAATAAAADDDAKPGKKQGKRDPEALFKRMDSNSDGKVSKEEFTKFFEAMKEKRAAKGKGGKGKGDPSKLFEKLDANGDGYLSLEEFKKFGEMRGKGKGKKKKNNEE
jgi:hypothetical protein